MPEKRKSRIESEIERNLRTAFGKVEEEGVPDRFVKLLEELRSRDGTSPSSESEDGGND